MEGRGRGGGVVSEYRQLWEVAGKTGSCANMSGTALVEYLLDDLDQILQDLPAFADVLVGDDGCGQVAEHVWTHGLNGVEVPGREQKFESKS